MYDDIIAAKSAAWNIPESWIKAVIQVESNWNASAYNPNDPGGAYGLMQIIAATAASYGVLDLAALYDPEINIDVGTHLMRDILNRWNIFDMGTDGFRAMYSAYNSGSPTLWQTSDEVRANVEKAVAALAQYATVTAEGAALIGLFLVLWFVTRKRV